MNTTGRFTFKTDPKNQIIKSSYEARTEEKLGAFQNYFTTQRTTIYASR
jgi:hypothetical protein